MDLKKLKAFIVVAEELNFRKSAELLNMSQPPLTRLISSLEKDLGVKLFERSTRKVQLTSAGIVLLKEAKEIHASLKRIEIDVKKASKVKQGYLKIGFSRTAFLARFPEILEAFKLKFPEVKLELSEVKSKDVLQGLKRGDYDCGFIEGHVPESLFRHQKIEAAQIGALLPSNHSLISKKSIQIEELKNDTIILHHKNESDFFHLLIDNVKSKTSFKPKLYIKKDTESCPILVATGQGISLTILGTHGVVPRKTRFIPIEGLFLPVHGVWMDQTPSPLLQTFLSFVTENKTLYENETICLHLG